MTPACVGLLEPSGSGLGLLKSTFRGLMQKISYAGCLVYIQPFRRNLVLKCVLHPKIAKNSLKPFLRGRVQSRSRSSMLINLKSLSPVLVYDKQFICNRFYTIRANNDTITSF